MCPLQGLSQGLADSRGSTNGCALKLTFKVHIDLSKGPLPASCRSLKTWDTLLSYPIPPPVSVPGPRVPSPHPTWRGRSPPRDGCTATPPLSPGHSLSFSQWRRPGGERRCGEHSPVGRATLILQGILFSKEESWSQTN